MNHRDESVERGARFLDAHPAEGPPFLLRTIDNNGQPIQRVRSLEIGELLAHSFPAQEPLLGPWLRKQTLAMVHAWRGVGKTHFALGAAYAVASGGGFLKWQAERPRKVLYIDGEMPGAAIQDRLRAIVGSPDGQPQPPAEYLRVVTPDVQEWALPDLATTQGQGDYDAVIQDAELIVIDNLSALSRTGPENEGESWLPIASWALARRREGRAVLFVHHEGKNGQQRGSSRREDLLDVVISLARPSDYAEQEGARFILKFKKARGLCGNDVDDIEAALSTDATGAQQWTWKRADAANDSRILELLQLGMSNSDVATEIGCNRSTIFRAKRRFIATGLLEDQNRKP
jgi:hypothetical protein